jgi:hypothetical protein
MPDPTDKPPAPSPQPEPREQIVSTDHRLALGDQMLEYSATCGTLLLRLYDEAGDAKARTAARARPTSRAPSSSSSPTRSKVPLRLRVR